MRACRRWRKGDWTAEQRASVERYETDGHSHNVVRTLSRVPALAGRVLPFTNYVANETTLSPRHRAILILRTAWLTQSANIWAAAASRAAESGLTPDELMHVAEGPGDDWDPFEAVLIGFADQMFRHAAVTDRTWDALAERYDTHNLIDAVMTVGWTTTNAILFNSLGIQPDERRPGRGPDAGRRRRLPGGGPRPGAAAHDAAHRAGRGRWAAGHADVPAASRRWWRPATSTPATCSTRSGRA